ARSPRVSVARGRIAYSAVTQPSPLPRRHLGTSSVALAAHSTRVAPNSTRTDPSACSSQPRVIRISRNWPGLRPSGRDMPESLVAGGAPAGHALISGAVGGPGPEPFVDPADPLGRRGPGPPAQLIGGPVYRQRAARQLTRARRGEHRRQRAARDPGDDLHQVEHADLHRRPDVPGTGPSPVSRGQKSLHHVTDIHVVTGLGAVTENRRLSRSERTGAENSKTPRLTGRILARPIYICQPQHRMRRLVQTVVQPDVALGAILCDPIGRFRQRQYILARRDRRIPSVERTTGG